MTRRCATCQEKDDLVNLKPSMSWVHPGECERWLRNREELGPPVWRTVVGDEKRAWRTVVTLIIGAVLAQLLFR